MLGLPRFKAKLPSRNWLIFLSVAGSFTTALLYDRHQQKLAQQRWCNLVSPLAQEPLPVGVMPRRITIILSGPPGDSLRIAREHFHEYIKPILVAGALDWEVIEGRREGEVKAGLAEKIRKLRRRNGEALAVQQLQNNEDDLLEEARTSCGIKDWDGVRGDLVLGRHTWKEYIRGLHEGWLDAHVPPTGEPAENHPVAAAEFFDPLPPHPASPADPPPSNPSIASKDSAESAPNATLPDSSSLTVTSLADSPLSNLSIASKDSADSAPNATLPDSPPSPAASDQSPEKSHSPIPPYVRPADYAAATLSASIPSSFTPTAVLPLPHLLGFLNTPTRIYRFLTRRRLADATGASVAALVLATNSRPYRSTTTPVSTQTDTLSPSPTDTFSEPHRRRWEQEDVLHHEEAEWHKSAWADEKDAEEKPPRDRVWREQMIIDDRIGERMRLFELDDQDRERALREEQELAARKRDWISDAKSWLGIAKDKTPKGWEMGLVGDPEE